MSQGIQKYGELGTSIAARATKLRNQGLLSSGEFQELTNATFSQKDFAAVNSAMAKTKTFDQLNTTSRLHSDLIKLQRNMDKDPAEKPVSFMDKGPAEKPVSFFESLTQFVRQLLQ